MVETVTGTNRSAGTPYTELLDADTHPVRDILRADSPMPPGPTKVPAEIYHSREIHEQEIENIWKRSWQLACHEDELKEVGDYVIYDITRLSFIVVKSGEDEYKAFYNQCLHRGRQLADQDGKRARHFRCSFHGWSWNLDGSLNEIPCQWDFPSIEAGNYKLPEVQTARWGGFIFINPDPDAEPLADYLQDLADHFTLLPFERRYKALHVAKVLRCNWKLAQEAFMEAYHVVATHPTILDIMGDANTKYDVFGNYSRAISPQQVESPHIAPYTPDEQAREFTRWKHPLSGLLYELGGDGLVHISKGSGEVSRFHADGSWVDGPITHADPNMCNWVGGKQLPDSESLPLTRVRDPGPGETKRAILAEQERERLREDLGELMDSVSDAELVDVAYFSVFPNWHPWGSFNPIFYRFRPNGDNPEECIHECWYMMPVPEGQERPEPAPVIWLGPDDDYTDAAELGALAKVFNQDVHNLPQVHKGLKGMKNPEVIFADYQESKIRHFYKHYKAHMGMD
jgi:phenylpropionate dioxygenase-like ring-hydroxylating dioxygenase large terminal subunit